MSTPVDNLTVDEAHAEFSKLTGLIATKNEELLWVGMVKLLVTSLSQKSRSYHLCTHV